MKLKKQSMIGPLSLLIAAFIWGVTFVAQDKGAAHVQAFTFQTFRSLVAVLALSSLVFFRDLTARKRGSYRPMTQREKKFLFLGGGVCGAILFTASGLQQFGIGNNITSPGKDAFITALYIVFVPVLGLFLKKRSAPHVYLCVVVALFGLWMLCMSGSAITLGDIQVILCAVAFSFHIMVVDAVAPHVDAVRLSCVQFSVVALLSLLCMLIFEHPTLAGILAAAGAFVFAGLFSSGIAFTLQTVGQGHTPSTLASLIMSLESVFAVAASIILLPEIPAPTLREWVGMVLIFAAIIFSQIPLKYPKRKRSIEQI